MTGHLTTIDFHGDTLFAVSDPGGALVAPKPISDALGLAWNKQLERIKRDPVLAEGMTIMGIPSPGGEQQTSMLRLHARRPRRQGAGATRMAGGPAGLGL